jgi:hypothetical protein
MSNLAICQSDLVFTVLGGTRHGHLLPIKTQKCILTLNEKGKPSAFARCAILRGKAGVTVRNLDHPILFNGEQKPIHWLQLGDRIEFPNQVVLQVSQLGHFSLNQDTSQCLLAVNQWSDQWSDIEETDDFENDLADQSQMQVQEVADHAQHHAEGHLEISSELRQQAQSSNGKAGEEDALVKQTMENRFTEIELRLASLSEQLSALISLASCGNFSSTPMAESEWTLQLRSTGLVESLASRPQVSDSSAAQDSLEQGQNTSAVAPCLTPAVSDETAKVESLNLTLENETSMNEESLSHCRPPDNPLQMRDSSPGSMKAEISDSAVDNGPSDYRIGTALDTTDIERDDPGSIVSDENHWIGKSKFFSINETIGTPSLNDNEALLRQIAELQRSLNLSEVLSNEPSPAAIQEPAPNESPEATLIPTRRAHENVATTLEDSVSADGFPQTEPAECWSPLLKVEPATNEPAIEPAIEPSLESNLNPVSDSIDIAALARKFSTLAEATGPFTSEAAGKSEIEPDLNNFEKHGDPIESLLNRLNNAVHSTELNSESDNEPNLGNGSKDHQNELNSLEQEESVPNSPGESGFQTNWDLMSRLRQEIDQDSLQEDSLAPPIASAAYEQTSCQSDSSFSSSEPASLNTNDNLADQEEAADSIEAYLSQLYERMQIGTEPTSSRSSKAKHASPESSAEESVPVRQSDQGVDLISATEYLPKQKGTKLESLDTMREIANATARTAVAFSDLDRRRTRGLMQIVISLGAVLMAAYYLLVVCKIAGDTASFVGVICLLLAGGAGFLAFRTFRGAKSLADLLPRRKGES